MKIALLTYNLGQNYGGILQAYALMETLKKLNHKPELLYIKTKFYNGNFKDLIKKYLLSNFTDKYNNYIYEDLIYKNMFYFIDKYINSKTEPLKEEKDFFNVTKNNYDAYIIGSDQVWRAKVFRYIDYAFFGFVQDNRPIFLSYAASFGVDYWEYTIEKTEKYKNQIQRFNAVSVREKSGIELCKKHFKKDAVHVLDPTMLLTADEYKNLLQKENELQHNGKLLTYILDDSNDKNELINMVSKELNIKPFKINAKEKNSKKLENMIYPTVTSWIKGFDDAEYVITDSFHGCVFSIIFNKPFLVLGNEKRGMARFESLLKMFELEHRLILKSNDLNIYKINEFIDWGLVNNKLNNYKKYSINFLIQALGISNECTL